jgi:hypothetical protein
MSARVEITETSPQIDHLLAAVEYPGPGAVALVRAPGAVGRPRLARSVPLADFWQAVMWAVVNDHNCWISTNPARLGSTGRSADLTAWANIVLDIDIKAGAAPDLESALAAVAVAASRLGPPAAVVHTGHGIQPWWPVAPMPLPDADAFDRAQDMNRQIHYKVGFLIERECGFRIDTTDDLARRARVPGTRNFKPGLEPVDSRLLIPAIEGVTP